MSHPNVILAESSASHPVTEIPGTSEIVIIGFLFVMVVLFFLSVITATVGGFFARQAKQSDARAAESANRLAEPVTTVEAGADAVAEEDDPAYIAVIAAAVHSVIGEQPHRIVSIRPGGPGLAQEGAAKSAHRTGGADILHTHNQLNI